MSRSESPRAGALRVIAVAAIGFLLGGCSTLGLGSDEPKSAAPASSSGSMTSSISEFFRNGSSTQPTPPARQDDQDVECPAVEVLDGGAAVRQGGPGGVRSQFSLGQTARECRVVGGQLVLKVGVEGRVLLGQVGTPGTYSTAVRIQVKRGDKVVASKLQRVSATIPSGDTQASFVVIEDNIAVPLGGDELSILVGFDPSGRAGEPQRKPKRG